MLQRVPHSTVQGDRDLTAQIEDLTYTQVAAGWFYTVLLSSDGSAVACGCNGGRECDLPAQDGDLTYTQIAAGMADTVLLRSGGSAVACGSIVQGDRDLTAQIEDLTYT